MPGMAGFSYRSDTAGKPWSCRAKGTRNGTAADGISADAGLAVFAAYPDLGHGHDDGRLHDVECDDGRSGVFRIPGVRVDRRVAGGRGGGGRHVVAVRPGLVVGWSWADYGYDLDVAGPPYSRPRAAPGPSGLLLQVKALVSISARKAS